VVLKEKAPPPPKGELIMEEINATAEKLYRKRKK